MTNQALNKQTHSYFKHEKNIKRNPPQYIPLFFCRQAKGKEQKLLTSEAMQTHYSVFGPTMGMLFAH